mmetsp:Transcript_18087/g.41130  ORF Transcript_18087/g.41130 Transcript_18087/m.41130 type:complete len:201 (+) Transcript_18087:860-1462(+)
MAAAAASDAFASGTAGESKPRRDSMEPLLGTGGTDGTGAACGAGPCGLDGAGPDAGRRVTAGRVCGRPPRDRKNFCSAAAQSSSLNATTWAVWVLTNISSSLGPPPPVRFRSTPAFSSRAALFSTFENLPKVPPPPLRSPPRTEESGDPVSSGSSSDGSAGSKIWPISPRGRSRTGRSACSSWTSHQERPVEESMRTRQT